MSWRNELNERAWKNEVEKMNIPRSVVGFLSSRGLVIATAESCTGGLIASLIADVPGSGACLDVGIVVYSPSGKCGVLNVQAQTIEEHGLTSEAVAREMATGVLALEACSAHIAVSNTGLAGPPPEGTDLAPGTQCFAWRYKRRDGEHMFSETRVFDGDRTTIRQRAALYALSRVEHYFNQLPNMRRASASSY
jgi:nicotinamide-nucleotide amidase